MTDDLKALSAAERKRAKAALKMLWSGSQVSMCTGCGSLLNRDEIKALYPTAISCCPERKMVLHSLVPAAAIEAARAEEREVWALAAQDIADSNHSYEAAKQFSRFARALRAGGEHD